MSRVMGAPLLSFVSAVALVLGLLLVSLAAWSWPLAEGVEAAREGNFELALQRYATVEARFDKVPAAKQVLPAAYHASIGNQLQLLYQRGEYDAVIEKADVSPAVGTIHFWSGCALFEKARAAEDPQDQVSWLERAEEELRKALEREPDDWDTKFNYELTRRLLAELREESTQPQQKMLPLLRPRPTQDQPARPIG